MSLEQWNLAINNVSNIWMAGMMTIQTIILAFAGYVGYKQYSTYKSKIIRDHAQKIYFLNKEVNSVLKLILSKYTINHSFDFDKEFPYVPKGFERMARGLKIGVDKIWDNQNEVNGKLASISIEIKFLSSNHLYHLFERKKSDIHEIFSIYRRTFTMLNEYNDNIQHGNDRPDEDDYIREAYCKLPDHLEDLNNLWSKEFSLLNNEIEENLLKIIKEN